MKLDFEKYQLANGLDVILRRDPRLPIVAVNLWYHVGPANETEGRTGFAHLFEHMMFQGSGHVENGSFFKLLEGAGASLVNGTTDFDRTNYMEDVPSNQLELALALESDRMGFLLDRLDESMLANQQDVVRNERRQNIEAEPYQLGDEELYHRLFPAGHPYHASVMGSHEDIQAARLSDVRQFARQFYTPNNASLAIVGDIDVARTKELVEKYFGTIARGPDVPPARAHTPPIAGEVKVTVTDQVALPRITMAWITDPIFTPGDAVAEIAGRILGGGKASRLYQSLVYDQQIAQQAYADQQSLTLGSVFAVAATAKPGHTADELEQAIQTELDRMASGGPTDLELAAAKSSISASVVMSLENIGGFSGVANRLNFYNHHLRDPGYLDRDLARFDAVTAKEVRDFVATTLATDRRVVVRVVPGEKIVPEGPPAPPMPERSTEPVVSSEPWRNQLPGPGPSRPAMLPAAKRFTLANGLTVDLIESHAVPVVTARIVVRTGSGSDPAGLPGLAGFTVAMMDEGTERRDALMIARELEALGARLGTEATADGSAITLRFLTRDADAALDILADVVLQPSFPPAEVERVRSQRATAILQERDMPEQTAIRTMVGALFGPTHPYGHVALGTEEAVAKVTRDDLRTFFRTQFTPDQAALVMAGDLTESDARALAERYFGAWSGARPSATPAPPPATIPERVVLVDKVGVPQTMLVVAQIGIPRSDPDFERWMILNEVLGGAFASRINMNLREKHGFTYGAFSALVQRRARAPYFIGASVRADATGASIAEIFKEVRGVVDAEVTADELAFAKEAISRSLPALFGTSFSTAATIGSLHQFDLPPDYYAGLPARLDAMTTADVLATAKRQVAPERMIVVAVGERAAIEGQIRELELGAIAVRSEPAGATAG